MSVPKAAVKRPPLPAVLHANHVLDGDVVVWTGSEWSFDPRAALVAEDDAQALELETVRDATQASGEVIEPYLVTVRREDDGQFVPVHYRERLRTLGPSVRRDLGKQADLMGAR